MCFLDVWDVSSIQLSLFLKEFFDVDHFFKGLLNLYNITSVLHFDFLATRHVGS